MVEPGEELTHMFPVKSIPWNTMFPVEIDTLEYSRVKCYIGIFCALADFICDVKKYQYVFLFIYVTFPHQFKGRGGHPPLLGQLKSKKFV
jgi:hypothetical protein